MPRIQGWTFLLLISPGALAAGSMQEQLQAFQGARAKLDADIVEFLRNVDSCGPPFKSRIVDGFGERPAAGSTPGGARFELSSYGKGVEARVSAAEEKLRAIHEELRSCRDKAELLGRAELAGRELQENLSQDLQLYRSGIEEANKSRPELLKALGARRMFWERQVQAAKLIGSDGPAQPAAVTHCDGAIQQISVLDQSNENLQARLQELQQAIPRRVALETVAIQAPNSCQGATLRKASFEPQEAPAVERGPESDGQTAI